MGGVDMVSEPATSVRPAETWMSDSVKLAPGASLNAKVTTELVSPSFSVPSTILTTTVGFSGIDAARIECRPCRSPRHPG